jgi:trimeric autotransporter adhesin
MSMLDAMFGVLENDGEELELLGRLNFIGFTITTDTVNKRHNIEAVGASSSDDVTNESGVTGATVTLALDALNTAIGALAASDIDNDSANVAGATVADALDTLDAAISAGGVPGTRQVIAGAGLTGGGDLSADRTLNIAAGNGTITVNADSIQVGTLVAGNFDNNTIALARLANAGAQFRIVGRKTASGGAWEDCTLAELGITTTGLGAVPTTRTLTAGAGLTGTGDLSADRTFAVVAADGTITVNADSIQVGTIGNTNLADNTVALARLANATAQYDFIMRTSSGAGAWERGARADLIAAIVGQTLSSATITALTATTLNGVTIAAPTQGTAITTTATITVGNGVNYVVSSAGGAYAITLGTSGTFPIGTIVTLICANALANAITVTNGGPGGTNIGPGASGTLAASIKAAYDFRWDGTNWSYSACKLIQ